jgi:hypothetical protein
MSDDSARDWLLNQVRPLVADEDFATPTRLIDRIGRRGFASEGKEPVRAKSAENEPVSKERLSQAIKLLQSVVPAQAYRAMTEALTVDLPAAQEMVGFYLGNLQSVGIKVGLPPGEILDVRDVAKIAKLVTAVAQFKGKPGDFGRDPLGLGAGVMGDEFFNAVFKGPGKDPGKDKDGKDLDKDSKDGKEGKVIPKSADSAEDGDKSDVKVPADMKVAPKPKKKVVVDKKVVVKPKPKGEQDKKAAAKKVAAAKPAPRASTQTEVATRSAGSSRRNYSVRSDVGGIASTASTNLDIGEEPETTGSSGGGSFDSSVSSSSSSGRSTTETHVSANLPAGQLSSVTMKAIKSKPVRNNTRYKNSAPQFDHLAKASDSRARAKADKAVTTTNDIAQKADHSTTKTLAKDGSKADSLTNKSNTPSPGVTATGRGGRHSKKSARSPNAYKRSKKAKKKGKSRGGATRTSKPKARNRSGAAAASPGKKVKAGSKKSTGARRSAKSRAGSGGSAARRKSSGSSKAKRKNYNPSKLKNAKAQGRKESASVRGNTNRANAKMNGLKKPRNRPHGERNKGKIRGAVASGKSRNQQSKRRSAANSARNTAHQHKRNAQGKAKGQVAKGQATQKGQAQKAQAQIELEKTKAKLTAETNAHAALATQVLDMTNAQRKALFAATLAAAKAALTVKLTAAKAKAKTDADTAKKKLNEANRLPSSATSTKRPRSRP